MPKHKYTINKCGLLSIEVDNGQNPPVPSGFHDCGRMWDPDRDQLRTPVDQTN